MNKIFVDGTLWNVDHFIFFSIDYYPNHTLKYHVEGVISGGAEYTIGEFETKKEAEDLLDIIAGIKE